MYNSMCGEIFLKQVLAKGCLTGATCNFYQFSVDSLPILKGLYGNPYIFDENDCLVRAGKVLTLLKLILIAGDSDSALSASRGSWEWSEKND